MLKNKVHAAIKALVISQLLAMICLPAVADATTYDTLYANIFNNSGNSAGIACTSCHLSTLVGAVDRHAAPEDPDAGGPLDGADFDLYASALARATTMDSYTDPANYPDGVGGFDAYMPMDPNQVDYTYLGVADLSVADRNAIKDWIADGLPKGVPIASNEDVLSLSISATGGTLRASVNTNVHTTTTVPGTYYFEYGVSGVDFSMGGVGTAVNRSDISEVIVSSPVTGLLCETTYQYRVVVTNGDSDVTDSSAHTFKTGNCSAPIIRLNLVAADTTESYSVGKGSSLNNAADFKLDATDIDGVSALSWTLDGAQPASGTASVSGTGATPTISYTATANVPVPDTVSFDVKVSDNSNDGSRFDTLTISIQVVDNPPTITNVVQPESIPVMEDDPNGESVTLTATDSDGDPLSWSVVGGTEPVNGTLNTFGSGNSQIVTYTPNANIDTDESFTVRVSDGASSADIVVNVDVMPSPDDPIANDDPGYIVLVNSVNTTLDVLANDTDIDSLDTKTLAAQTITGNQGGTILVNNPGVINNDISYSPAADVVAVETFTYTVTDSFGGTDTGMVVVSPPDTDADGVFDYIDNCAATPNGPLGGPDNQADNDSDQVINVNTTVDPADSLVGGDACDTDDDNDGMADADELLFPSCLDKFDASDATKDCDGDGIDNITEVNDGDINTDPGSDSVGPVVNAPPDMTVNATGLLTAVDLGTATGADGNDGAVTIFKTALGLSQTEIDILDDPLTGCTVLSSYETVIKPFRPGRYEVTWASCDAAGNSGHDTQVVNVKPLVSVNSGQSVGEGQPVSVNVVLNGNAISYPATVEYSITGTAAAIDDHDAVAGAVSFASPGDVGVINFNTAADGVTVGDASEGDETVVITLHTPSKIALSSANVHTVTITEANVAPQVALSVSQPAAALDKNKGNTLYTADGAAKIVASASDGNGDTLSFDWSATDNTLLGLASITGDQIDIDPNLLTTGSFYKVVVTVSDGITPVTVERLLLVKAGEVNVWLVGADADGDGKLNVDEGYGDDDADGIPNYIDSNSTPPSAIENHTVNLKTSVYIETDPGLKIAMGETAIAAQTSGVLISMQDIMDHGGAGGIAVVNAATDYVFFSGLLNFEISGLTDDMPSANVVIPLSSAIQADAVYRKYNNSGWFDFIEDDLNALSSAAGNDGTCPQPGSNLYTAGLTPGHLCLQLTIQDGGANDADGVRNFVIRDPGGLALEAESDVVVAPSDASGRVGSVGLWSMLILSITAAAVWRLRVRAAVNAAG